ncbi:MAG TPA: site-specific integrase [Bryobacteraceae bacterium]|nr:site-specific integrase [Bryobacteraceae bacterium]
MALFRRGDIWWYDFLFARRRVRESAKTNSKTVAKQAEQNRRRELERGFNGIEDNREERIRSIKDVAANYLEDYSLRHKWGVFAQYAVGHVTRHLGGSMMVDVTDKTVREYQTARLKEGAAPKSINEEVGFLLRLLGEAGDVVRMRLRRQKALKLAVGKQVGKAYTPEEKEALIAAARAARSPAIYPTLMLALNAGMRDAEIRGLQWDRMDLTKAILTVGESKTEAGEGRTIPLNSTLLEAMVEYEKWYAKRFGKIQPEWFVFAFGKPRPNDPTRPIVTLKTSWNNVRTKAGVTGRWHDNRHTLITDLAESGAADETIRDIAGHVSKQMLKHYSHIRMAAKRGALEGIVAKPKPHEAAESASTSREQVVEFRPSSFRRLPKRAPAA